jgi:hypothetical protein
LGEKEGRGKEIEKRVYLRIKVIQEIFVGNKGVGSRGDELRDNCRKRVVLSKWQLGIC